MSPIQKCIKNGDTRVNTIWLMRQAGRYLPEFRDIRAKNPDFIKLCLNEKLSTEISLQPLRRFDLDAGIIFSDILMLPYGLGQSVEFKKNFGPELGEVQIENLSNQSEAQFIKKLLPVYNLINNMSKSEIIKEKDLFGFVGAPWTLLVYMINRMSPKKKLNKNFFNNKDLIDKLLKVIVKFTKIHLKHQVRAGATIIQIFDSWAGLVDEKDLEYFIYKPTREIVNFSKSLNVPVICFPREIKDYKKFVETINPDVVSIDYNIDPKDISDTIQIPIQGGLDPKILLSNKENLKIEAKRYLDIFKDHPYIFNLGHGVLPETDPNMVDYLVKMVKDY
jgi:uroporphyrinogen decarboxylase